MHKIRDPTFILICDMNKGLEDIVLIIFHQSSLLVKFFYYYFFHLVLFYNNLPCDDYFI